MSNHGNVLGMLAEQSRAEALIRWQSLDFGRRNQRTAEMDDEKTGRRQDIAIRTGGSYVVGQTLFSHYRRKWCLTYLPPGWPSESSRTIARYMTEAAANRRKTALISATVAMAVETDGGR